MSRWLVAMAVVLLMSRWAAAALSGTVLKIEVRGIDGKRATAQVLAKAREILADRLTEIGGVMSTEDGARYVVFLPSGVDVARAKQSLLRLARLELKLERVNRKTGKEYWETVLDGTAVQRATALPMEEGGDRGMIRLEMTPAGARKLAAITANAVGKQLGIFFDGALLSSPVIRTTIYEKADISGLPSLAVAQEIAAAINSPLPAKVILLSEDVVK